MKVNCQDHRNTMELLALKIKLEKGVSDPIERNMIEKRIKALEESLQLN